MLHAEFVVINRQAGPTRRDPRMEIGWQLLESAEPVIQTTGRHHLEVSTLATGEPAFVLPNE